MTKRTMAVTVLIETDDPRLFPENFDVSTVGKAARIRQAVIRALPNLTRVVLVMDEEMAQLMMFAHDMAAAEAQVEIMRPPADYVPPTRE